MEEDVGIVLDEGVIINRHSMRRILRGPGDVEPLVRFIFVLSLLPGVCRVRFILLLTLTYTPSARRRVHRLRRSNLGRCVFVGSFMRLYYYLGQC
jgi:hypothetical protein